MGGTQIALLVIGILSMILGISGITNKSRKGQRMVRFVGETGARLIYTLIGLIIVLVAIFI